MRTESFVRLSLIISFSFQEIKMSCFVRCIHFLDIKKKSSPLDISFVDLEKMGNLTETIDSVTYAVSVYIGSFIIICGLIGNSVNILVFTQLKVFRKNQSAFYLTVASLVECCQLIFTASTRVISAVTNYDPTGTSLVWCKLRTYIIQNIGLLSVAVVSIAAIDQYLSTSYRHRLRSISTFELAQHLTIIVLFVATIYSIPFLIYYQIRPTRGCAIYDPAFNYFYSFVHLCIVLGIVPITISSFFSCLAYRNVRRIIRHQVPIARQRLEQQLTAMILVRVALFVLAISPYVAYRIYQVNSSIALTGSSLTSAIDQLVRAFTLTSYNLSFAVSLY